MTDEQIEAIATYATCPRCGCPCRPATASLTAHDSLRGWVCSFNAEVESHDGMELCGWEGNVRDLVEAALKRAGVQLAEPWRSDEPPEGARVELRHRSGWIAVGVFTTSYRNGELHRMLDMENGRVPQSVATDFEDIRWRPAGPNPFEKPDRKDGPDGSEVKR